MHMLRHMPILAQSKDLVSDISFLNLLFDLILKILEVLDFFRGE